MHIFVLFHVFHTISIMSIIYLCILCSTFSISKCRCSSQIKTKQQQSSELFGGFSTAQKNANRSLPSYAKKFNCKLFGCKHTTADHKQRNDSLLLSSEFESTRENHASGENMTNQLSMSCVSVDQSNTICDSNTYSMKSKLTVAQSHHQFVPQSHHQFVPQSLSTVKPEIQNLLMGRWPVPSRSMSRTIRMFIAAEERGKYRNYP